MYYFVKSGGIKAGQELWLDYGAVSFGHCATSNETKHKSLSKAFQHSQHSLSGPNVHEVLASGAWQ